MSKKQMTRRALLTSVISLILCCAMLVGTTFAWFTDSVTSGVNQIVAGNLDVELYYKNDTVTTWTEVSSTTNIFKEDTLWEPGHTEVVYLQVKNAGTLNLKYQLGVNVVSQTGSINVAGAEFKLSDYIQYGLIETEDVYSNRADAVKDVTNATALTNTYSSDIIPLAPNATKTVALVVYMPETVGNEANYRIGENKPTILLGLNVYATQVEAENDSFGNDYDADAVASDVVVDTKEELLEAISDPAMKVIAIDGDLTFNWGGQSYDNSQALLLKGKTLIGYNGNASITFAGYGSANPLTDVTLKNITVKDDTEGDNEGSWEHGHLEFNGLNAKNVVFANSIMLDGTCVIDNCTFDNEVPSWYEMWIEGGNVTVKNSTFSGTRAIKIHEAYGSEVASVTVDNCRFVSLSEKPGVVIGDLNAATSVTIKNSTFYKCNAGDQNLYIYETDTGVAGFTFKADNNTVITNGTNGVASDGNGTYYTESASDLTSAIKAGDCDTVVLMADTDVSGTQLVLDKPVTIDLNGNALTSSNNYGGTTLSNGASIKNGTINHIGNTAAIKVSGEAGTIENVTINVTPTAGKTKTGIQVYNGKYVKEIKNVTITGVTQGIEVAKGSRVDLIEKVKVNAVADSNKKGVALLVNAASVGKAVNCTFNGDYGVYMMLNGEFHVALEMENCNVTGTTAAVIAHDEAGIANITNCSLSLTYDAATKINGEFVWNFEEECQGVVTLNKP